MKYLIQQPLNEYTAVRKVIKRCDKYSPVVSVAGGTQKGKTLFSKSLADCISERVYKKKFNFKKNTCLTINQFIERVGSSKNEVIIIEETANQLNKGNWYDDDSKDTFFTLISQAFRRNLYIFVQPHLSDVSKSNRTFVNFQFVIEKKYESIKACWIKPQEIIRVYWDLIKKGFYVDMTMPPFYYVYTEKEFKEGKEYTDWIEENLKDKRIMKDLLIKRGIHKPKEFFTDKTTPIKI